MTKVGNPNISTRHDALDRRPSDSTTTLRSGGAVDIDVDASPFFAFANTSSGPQPNARVSDQCGHVMRPVAS